MSKGILKDFAKTEPEVLRQHKIEVGRENFRTFCNLRDPKFFKPTRKMQDILCDTLQGLYEKTLINEETGLPYEILCINLPPGHGKSYTASNFVTWCYGQDVKNQVISVSYNQTLSTRFAKTTREQIEDQEIKGDPEYFVAKSFFPKLKIKQGDGAMDLWTLEGAYMSYLATSFDGSITGMRGNIALIDDPIKNKYEAMNERIKDNHWDWYKNTFLSRVLEGGIQIIIMTRWASDDLAGRVIAEFPEKTFVLNMPVVSQEGEPLCAEILSNKGIADKRKGIDQDIFLANYMQEPIDKQGGLYGEFQIHDFDGLRDQDAFERIFSYTDTADEGADFLASFCVGQIGEDGYILDIYYTEEPMEITEAETARRQHIYGVREAVVESNNGGRGFARKVEEKLKDIYRNKKCRMFWFHQSKNKKTRILVNSTDAMSRLYMPRGWEKRFSEAYKDITGYQRKGKNAHDDIADALTGCIEYMNGEIKVKKGFKVMSKKRLGL